MRDHLLALANPGNAGAMAAYSLTSPKVMLTTVTVVLVPALQRMMEVMTSASKFAHTYSLSRMKMRRQAVTSHGVETYTVTVSGIVCTRLMA